MGRWVEIKWTFQRQKLGLLCLHPPTRDSELGTLGIPAPWKQGSSFSTPFSDVSAVSVLCRFSVFYSFSGFLGMLRCVLVSVVLWDRGER